MATLIQLELAQGRGTALINPDHIVSVTEEVTLETGDPVTRVVLNIYSQLAQATGNAPFILVEETPPEVLQKMEDAAGPQTPVIVDDNDNDTVTVDPNAPIGSIGQIVLWKLPPGKVISDLFNDTGFGIDPIVEGWAICNGQNNTVDLRGRVPVGWDPEDTEFGTLGAAGGAKTHRLSVDEMPSHNHDVTYNYTGNVLGGGSQALEDGPLNDGNASGAIRIGNRGGSAEHNNLQPYRVGLFIQRISGVSVLATGTSSTPTSVPSTVTEAYVDNAIATALSAASPIKIKDFGTKVLGNLPGNSNFTETIGLNVVLPDNNYIAMVTVVGTPATFDRDNNVHAIVYDKNTSFFKISIDTPDFTENVSIDWIVYQA